MHMTGPITSLFLYFPIMTCNTGNYTTKTFAFGLTLCVAMVWNLVYKIPFLMLGQCARIWKWSWIWVKWLKNLFVKRPRICYAFVTLCYALIRICYTSQLHDFVRKGELFIKNIYLRKVLILLFRILKWFINKIPIWHKGALMQIWKSANIFVFIWK